MYVLQHITLWHDGGTRWTNITEDKDLKQLKEVRLPWYKKFHKKQMESIPLIEGHRYRIIKYEVIEKEM